MVYSVSYLPLPANDTWAGRAFNWYGGMSGGSNRYGFFKEVGSACKASFLMSDEEGNEWQDTLDHGISHEASLRYQGAMFIYPDWGEQLSLQWAATMFGRHPTAYQADVYFESIDVPSMDEYRAGKRPEWKTTVHDRFFRKDLIEKKLLESAE